MNIDLKKKRLHQVNSDANVGDTRETTAPVDSESAVDNGGSTNPVGTTSDGAAPPEMPRIEVEAPRESIHVGAGGGHAPPPPPIATAGETPDPFDPDSLRLPQDFASTLAIKKVLLKVPVRKPSKEWFVQAHQSYQIQTNLIELKEDRESYLVRPDLWPALHGEATFGPRALMAAINRQGIVFVWPVRLPGPDGKIDDWNSSLLEAAAMARDQWVRVTANMDRGAYDVSPAPVILPPPAWPDLSFRDLLEIAFKGHFIDSLDHLVLRRLRGEV